jgi:hypothetical protein
MTRLRRHDLDYAASSASARYAERKRAAQKAADERLARDPRHIEWTRAFDAARIAVLAEVHERFGNPVTTERFSEALEYQARRHGEVEREVTAAVYGTQRYAVRYYDAALSRKGRGVQVCVFRDRAAAEEFAASNRLYGKPCKVEVTP